MEPDLIQIYTLGTLRVERDGEPLALRRKDVLLLAYLALHDRAVTRTAAASLLWGESTDQAARLSLRQALWRLRNEIGDVIVSTPTTLSVDTAALSIDVRDLESHVEAGRYREAAQLFGGSFLDGADTGVTNEFERWADDVRGRVGQRIALARQQLVRDAVRNGDWERASQHAASWCREAPLDANAALEYARALRAGGRAAEALANLTAFSTAFTRDAASALPVSARADIEQLSKALRQEADRGAPPENSTRTDAHGLLISLWERCTFGNSAATLISGTPSECTRLARAFLQWVDARGSGMVVLHTSALRNESGTPWRALCNVIDGLRSAPGVGGAADDAVAQLSAWSSFLRDRFPRLAAVEQNPALVEDALRRVLDAVAEEAPVMLCIENMQLCDAASAAVFESLATRLPARTLLVTTIDDASASRLAWTAIVDPANTIELPRRRRHGRTLAWVSGLAACAVLITGAIVRERMASTDAGPIAVGIIQVVGERDTLSLSDAVPGLLATKLGLIPELEVISSARMHEVRAQSGTLSTDSASVSSVTARRTGARTLIEGELYRQRGEMRLALRRVRLSTGKVEASFEASSTNVFTLVDDIADQIARSYNVELPRQRIAGATTTSIVAYKFYEQGLRAYYQNDLESAHRDFMAALDQDSTFAMAAFYAAHSFVTPDVAAALFERAVRLSATAGDRDRLLIQAQWAVRNHSPNLFAIADTLTVRYPHEPDGHFYLGQAALNAGRFPEAAKHMQLALTLDSLALLGRTVPCRACEAIGGLVTAYQWMDSTRASERVGRKWVQLQPWSTVAWGSLASDLELQGRFAAAESMFIRSEAVQPELSDLNSHYFGMALRKGNFRAADSITAIGLQTEDASARHQAEFQSLLSFRAQGRMREAFVIATRQRNAEPDSIAKTGVTAQQARALMEMGRAREAAALYDSVARQIIGTNSGTNRSGAAPPLANEAAALASLRDTARLAALEAEVRYYGGLSIGAREHDLHFYVHGLRQELAGDIQGAIASYQRAVYSPTFGNVRVSLALGRALVAGGRPAEAVPVLDAAIRGALGASGTPIPKTELHEAIARAYDAMGDYRRATAEYMWVLNAWRNADAIYASRRAQIQDRLKRLGHSG